MKKILIVEDDTGIAEFVRLELEHEGFAVAVADSGRKALEAFSAFGPDIILLDIMLPELSGVEVLRRIRKTSQVPVILVTARGEMYDKVNGLDAGADDYLVKPFEIEELLARMRAVLRRSVAGRTVSSVLSVKQLELHIDSMEASIQGEKINLSKTEFLLLKTLLEHKNTVLSRDQIITAVWGKDHYLEENTVDVYIRYLRSKIDEHSSDEYIQTVRGSGYMIKDEP
ncbi:MAG: response regulator transcription factor [Treponema sp.]|nr:response regulator transcription factor [Treponema sp.]